MRTQVVIFLATCAVAIAQPAPNPLPKPDQKQPAAGLYQRPTGPRSHEEKENFFTSSTKLVNKNDVDYGAMFERRRQVFLDASAANPFFWYSALTTAILMVLMFAYGVRVMDEKRKLWHAAEILTDVWNQEQYSQSVAQTATERYNRHMLDCNRVIEAQVSGRPSPGMFEANDAR